MKTMKNLIGIMLLLMVSMTVCAQEVVVSIGEFTGGTVSVKEKNGQDVTITVTPDKDYFIAKSDVTVIAVKDPATLTRSDDEAEIPVGGALTLTGDDPEDLTLSRVYTFTVPEGLGAWVCGANFHEVDKPVTSGNLNADVEWEVTSDETTATTTLTLSGDGAATLDSKTSATYPWETFAADITDMVVEEGVQALGDGIIEGCTALQTITLKGRKMVGLGNNKLTDAITVDVYGLLYNEYKADADWGAATIASTGSEEMKGVAFGSNNEYDVFVTKEAMLVPSVLEAYTVTAIDGSNVKISPVKDRIIPAGVPVLLFSKDTKDDDFRTVTTDEKGETTSSLLKAAPSGGKPVTLGQVYLLYNDVFYLSQEGTIPEGGVYLPLTDEEDNQGEGKETETPKRTRAFLTIGGENTTAIDKARISAIDSQLSGKWYGLDGRSLNTTPSRKGIYIRDGKKIVVR